MTEDLTRKLLAQSGKGYQLKPGQWGTPRPTIPLILSRFQREPDARCLPWWIEWIGGAVYGGCA